MDNHVGLSQEVGDVLKERDVGVVIALVLESVAAAKKRGRGVKQERATTEGYGEEVGQRKLGNQEEELAPVSIHGRECA